MNAIWEFSFYVYLFIYVIMSALIPQVGIQFTLQYIFVENHTGKQTTYMQACAERYQEWGEGACGLAPPRFFGASFRGTSTGVRMQTAHPQLVWFDGLEGSASGLITPVELATEGTTRTLPRLHSFTSCCSHASPKQEQMPNRNPENLVRNTQANNVCVGIWACVRPCLRVRQCVWRPFFPPKCSPTLLN